MSALTTAPARVLAAAVALAAIVAVTILVWPASAADKARADGKHLGEAVGELYHAQGVGESAVPDGVVVRIELLDLHGLDARVEAVGTLHQQVEGFLHATNAIRTRDDHRLRRPPPAAPGREGLEGTHGVRDGQRGAGGQGAGGCNELAA